MGSFIFEQDQFSCTRDSVQVKTTPSAAPLGDQRSAAPATGASEDTLRRQRNHAELLRQVPPNYAHANPMQYLQSDQHGFDAHRAKIFEIILFLFFSALSSAIRLIFRPHPSNGPIFHVRRRRRTRRAAVRSVSGRSKPTARATSSGSAGLRWGWVQQRGGALLSRCNGGMKTNLRSSPVVWFVVCEAHNVCIPITCPGSTNTKQHLWR